MWRITWLKEVALKAYMVQYLEFFSTRQKKKTVGKSVPQMCHSEGIVVNQRS